jgi:glycosyltransferase involved in cell wall biosynthesis
MKARGNENRLRVLAICAFPVEAAATRFRLKQFVDPLNERGIDLEIVPFLSSEQFNTLYRSGSLTPKAASMGVAVLKRVAQTLKVRRYHVLLVQREAMIFGPGLFEWLYQKLGDMPMVLDLDDATYVRYVSPTYGRMGNVLKSFGKTDNLIRRASVVTCGNRFIAEHATSIGTPAVIVPTVVNPDEYRPIEVRTESEIPTLGWIGTHSTFPFLEGLFPVFEKLAQKHNLRLKIVGAGRDIPEIRGLQLVNCDWNLSREVEDFRSLDIGLYPIRVTSSANEEWIRGKSGFKAVQYMAVGIPFVMSPVGICEEMGEPGKTHFNANSEDDWYTCLNMLLSDKDMRLRMGSAGREHALANYSLEQHADIFAGALLDTTLAKTKR